MTLFHNFLTLSDLPQKILFAIFYHAVPQEQRTPFILFSIVQAFEHGLITVFHDKEQERFWIEPIDNKEFMFFMAQQFSQNEPLFKRTQELFEFIKQNSEKYHIDKPNNKHPAI